MTVLAWDGKTLAADKRAVVGGGLRRTVTKIQRYKSVLLGATGDWDIAMQLMEWWKADAVPDKFHEVFRKAEATLIVISRTGILTWNSGPYPLPHECEKAAFGSGRDYAEMAMYLGKSAKEAVELACLFQSDCGDGVDTLSL